MFGNVVDQAIDYSVPAVQEEDISCLKLSPSVSPQYLIAGSWGNTARCWQIQQSGAAISANPCAEIKMDDAILSCDWIDNQRAIIAGVDKTARIWTLGNPTLQTVAKHDLPIKKAIWIPEMNLMCTASWDATLRYWDPRNPNPVGVVKLPDKIFAMDAKYPLLVAATSSANRDVYIYDLNKPDKEFKKMDSPLKLQTRCVTCFGSKSANDQGYTIGSVEGRVGVHYLNDPTGKQSFAFRCHRTSDNSVAYPVHDIKFSHLGTFATCGADGTYSFWDKDSKSKLKSLQKGYDQPLVACDFNSDSTLFAFASSYDWHMGHNYKANSKPAIYIHKVLPSEIEKKQKK